MQRKQSSGNFRIKQNPKNKINPVIQQPIINESQNQSVNKTNYSWLFQDSIDQSEILKQNLAANINQNLKANIDLKDVNQSLVKSTKFMSQLNKSITTNFWQTNQSFLGINDSRNEEELIDDQRDEKMFSNMNDSFELQLEDRDQKEIVGEDIESDYYSHYKKLQKIKQQNQHFQDIKNSVYTSMLKVSEQNYITPQKLGLIKKEGQEDTIKINNRKIGDKYAEMLGKGIQKSSKVSKFHLKNNRISYNSSEKLIHQISKYGKIIDLSENEIGRKGCEFIASSLSLKSRNIQHLNLESNKLGDNSVQLILESSVDNKSLKYLNLSKNFLTDKNKDLLYNLINEHPILEEFYLAWNNLRAPSGTAIFQGLLENKNSSLKVLDISCNNLGISSGINQENGCAQIISDCFEQNDELVHVDLSFNRFNTNQTQIIATGLEKNHTIYGIHFSGNAGYVDSRGFIIVQKDIDDIEIDCAILRQNIDGVKQVQNKLARHHRDINLKDCCWICQGWEEMTFKWTKGVSGNGETDPLFIHFNFENFQPCYFGKIDSSELTYTRMIPPGELYYFFSNGQGEDQNIAIDHPQQKIGIESLMNDITLIEGDKKNVQLINTNYEKVAVKTNMFVQYTPRTNIKPRIRDPIFIPDKKRKTKKKWTFPISLMYKWKPDNEELIARCFDFDWNLSRIPKVVKKEDELEKVRVFLKERYQLIKNTYKYYATLNPVQDVWGIQTGQFFEIINELNIIDNLVKDADVNIKWTSVISGGEKGNPRNPIQAVNRHQFMECWIRLAEEKYIFKYKSTLSHSEALKMLWNDHLEKLFNKFDQQKWREERYWNEDCDYCLKHYKKLIDYIYKQFAKKKVKPGQIPFMCLDELNQIITLCNLTAEESFGSSVFLFAFNMSMMTQENEIGGNRIFEMSYVEYYEALARIAEEASLIPVLGPYGVHQNENKDVWTLEKRKNQSLGHKIEALIWKMYDCCTDLAYKQNNPKLERSFFWQDPDESEYDLVD